MSCLGLQLPEFEEVPAVFLGDFWVICQPRVIYYEGYAGGREMPLLLHWLLTNSDGMASLAALIWEKGAINTMIFVIDSDMLD